MEGLPAPSKQLVKRRCTFPNVIGEKSAELNHLDWCQELALQFKPQFDYAMQSRTLPNTKRQFSVLDQAGGVANTGLGRSFLVVLSVRLGAVVGSR